MEIKIINNQNTWQKFFEENGSPSFLHSWEWGKFQEKQGSKIIRLGIYDKNNLFAIVLVIKIRSKRGNFLFVPHGPILRIPHFSRLWRDSRGKQNLESFDFVQDKFRIKNYELRIKNILSTLVNYLTEIAKKEKFDFIRIAPVLSNNPENKDLFKNLGFKDSPIYMHAERIWQLPLGLPADKLLEQMRKSTRYSINRAIRENVMIEKRTDQKSIDDFLEIYKQTATREQFIPFSPKFIQNEFESFNQNNNALFLFAIINNKNNNKTKFLSPVSCLSKQALSDSSQCEVERKASSPDLQLGCGVTWRKNFSFIDNTIASALIIFTKSTAFYHQGATTHAKVPGSHLLQWEAIKEAKKRGCQYYNFWGIHQPGRTPKNWDGLSLFKQGFGGEQIDYLTTQDLILSPKYYLTYWYEKYLNWRRGV